MKKALLFSSLIALAILFGTSVFLKYDSKEYYEPREGHAEKGISGAMDWLHMLRANHITGEVDNREVLKAREKVKMADEKHRHRKSTSALDLNWEVVGPDNIGGRTRAFLIDKNDHNVMYAGSVTGGLFRSDNKGASWYPVSDPGSNLGVVSIAQASDGTIYYGTGEDMYNRADATGTASSPGFVGGGIYKSTDGLNFTVLPSTVPNAIARGAEFSSVGKIAVDPNDDNRIYAATNRGLRLSTDGGESWDNPVTDPPQEAIKGATDMFVTPSGKVWVKVGSTIQFSETGDIGTFNEVSSGSPGANGLPQNNNRSRIAVSPQDENYVYVVSIDGNDAFDKAYQSKDEGKTWRVIGRQSSLLNPHANQGRYNNALRVSPHDKERILVGGLDVYEWSEAGGWQQLSLWFLDPSQPYYVHADNHDFVFHPTQRNTFFIVNDGGIFRTTDNGETFTALNNNYITMQFYHIGLGPNGMVMGGSQDNGTVLLDPANSTFPKNAVKVRGGDGGYSQLSKLHPGVGINEIYYGQAQRMVPNTEGGSGFFDLERIDGTPPTYRTPTFAGWIMPYVLWEKLNDPHSTDSIRFGADSLSTHMGFGGGATTFRGSFTKPFDTTIIIPNGARITAGGRVLETNANAEFVNADGDVVGNLDTETGDFEVVFDEPIFQNVIATAAIRYNQGSKFSFESAINDLPVRYTLPHDLEPGEFVMIQDPVQAAFFMGPISRHKNRNNKGGIWMTREILSNLSGIPEWWHIGDLADGEKPISMAVSDDGDLLFVGTSSGRIYRFSNLINARDSASADIDHNYDFGGTLIDSSSSVVEKSIIGNYSGRVITSLATHPFDKEKLIVTTGGYGNSTYVYYSDDATAENPSLVSVQGDLPEMPVYASTFNYTAPNNETQVLVGTEFGVYATTNVEAGNVEWTHEINNFSNVPVFSLVQERTVRYDLKQPMQDFEGTIYAGTYGRGIQKTRSTARYVGTEEPEVEDEPRLTQVLNVYPNPATDLVHIELSLEARTDVEVSVYDMNGKMLKRAKYNKLPMETQNIELRVGGLPKGAYVISMQHGGRMTSGKFIKE